MKSRFIIVLALLMMIAALVPGVSAQDFPCGGLSADDCNALTTAFSNMGTVTSGTYTLNGVIDVQSIDPTQAMNMTMGIDGKFNGVPALPAVTNMAGLADPTALLGQAGAGMQGFSGEVNVKLGLPMQAAAMTGGATNLTLNLRFVDGNVYVNLDALAESLGPQMAAAFQIQKGWGGLKLAEGLPTLGAMAGGMTGGATGGTTDMTKMTADVAKIQQAIYKYISMTRDGNTFNGTVDFAGLINDPDIQATMEKPPTAADLEKATTALKDVKFNLAITLNDASQIGGIKLTVSAPESALQLLNSGSSSPAPTSVNIDMDLQYADLGTPQTITAPDGANLATIDELMQGVFGMMGAMSG